jgi:hypothetical protein
MNELHSYNNILHFHSQQYTFVTANSYSTLLIKKIS